MTDALRVDPVPRRWLWIGSALALILAFAQSPGRIVADTKHDLTVDPVGFLARAGHQWSSLAPLGQVQNQAYGYFFPHGAFFAVFDLVGMPAWVTQRLWWGLLLAAGLWGVVRLADALGVGSRPARIVAAAVYALSPRVLTTLGAISSETLPMMLAPWVLLPVVYALGPPERRRRSMRAYAAGSAAAVALMGAVNAVATLAAVAVTGLWWLMHRPTPAWRRFTAWWLPSLVLACLWWIVPLLLLGRVSPPFLDHIESSVTTTYWASLPELLRGAGSWAPFVSDERLAGAGLVSRTVLVLATGLLAAAGLAGLVLRGMPARGRLTVILLTGLTLMALGYGGALGSPIADQVQALLDGSLAPLRNVHKFEPLVRLPLVLGLAHLIGRVPLPGAAPWHRVRAAAAHPEHRPRYAVTTLVLTIALVATSTAWSGRLAPAGTYEKVPDHWSQAADWLTDNAAGIGDDGAPDRSRDVRALVVPGSGFAEQGWGLTRDEPLQPLATTPWAVRDAIPLTPPGAIRALDSVQRLLVTGTPSDALAPTLRGQGIGYLVVRNDLNTRRSGAPAPALVHQAIDGSPGLTRVASFGADYFSDPDEGVVLDSGLRLNYPAIEIYRVSGGDEAGPYTADLDAVPVLAGGPEALLGQQLRGVPGDGRPLPTLLYADAVAAGLNPAAVRMTDTPGLREEDYGRLDGATSALRTPGQRHHTPNPVFDYPAGADPVTGRWRGAEVTVSDSAADATALPQVDPSAAAAAAFDGDVRTGWRSRTGGGAVGRWLQLDLDEPIEAGTVHLTLDEHTAGPAVTEVEVSTDAGSTRVQIPAPGTRVAAPLPLGTTDRIRITAMRTADRTAGSQFGLAEVELAVGGEPVPIDFTAELPAPPDGPAVTGFSLAAHLPGRAGCVETKDAVVCVPGLARGGEEDGPWRRTLTATTTDALRPSLTVRARPGEALDELLADPAGITVAGPAMSADPRGGAGALVDGDPRTAWTAPSATRDAAAPRPTLTVRLPEESTVGALRLAPPESELPARIEQVVVDLGTGPQLREVDEDGLVTLTPADTDTVRISVTGWEELLDHSAAASGPALPGAAGLSVYADRRGTEPVGPVPDPEREIHLPCGQGPVLAMAGSVIHTSVTTTADRLRAGLPVTATVCDDAVFTPLIGAQDLDVVPGPALSVERVELDAIDPLTGGPRAETFGGTDAEDETAALTAVPADEWGPDRRVMELAPSGAARLLVVPESINPGWRARTADGTTLEPVTVSGWQQGWLVPAGTGGEVTLEFTTDTAYRAGLFGGLALLPILAALALVPGRRRIDRSAAAPVWRPGPVAAVGVPATAWLLSGTAGLLAGAAVGIVMAVSGATRPGRARRRWAIGAGASAALAAGLLAQNPWPDGDYAGHGVPAQLCAAVAVLVTGFAAVPAGPSGESDGAGGSGFFGRARARLSAALRARVRRVSQRTSARRAGSSTSP